MRKHLETARRYRRIFPSDVEKYTFGGTLEVMEKEYADGNLFKADSIEALAEMMFSILTYLPASIARITRSMFSSVPWISIVTLPSHSFLTQPV
jgi:hypothetical protein